MNCIRIATFPIWLAIWPGFILNTTVLMAQDDTDADVDNTGTAASADSAHNETSSSESGEFSEIHNQMRAMQSELVHQSAEIKTLKEKNLETDAQNKLLQSRLDDFEDNMALASLENTEASEMSRLLNIFGFFDLTFFKGFFDDNGIFNLYVPDKSTFAVSNANIYFRSQLTDNLTALTELNFSFLPSGQETSFEVRTILPNGTVINLPDGYERIDTTVQDPITTREFQQGGVTIERVHLTYSPFDWFNILAGRFLTPYGIWNIDHGSPVVLSARIPTLQYREFVPHAQTGIQVFGRFFPGDRIALDYAVTLSNGRGPTEAVFDLDENKGIGLRLKLKYKNPVATFVMGTYGYTGTSTDIKKRAVAYLNNNNELDSTRNQPVKIHTITTESFREYSLSYDMLLTLFDVTLQAEAAMNRVLFSKNRALTPIDGSLNGASIDEEWFMPSYTGYGVYVLLSYQLPIPITWLRLTPYILGEWTSSFEVLEVGDSKSITTGLNFKPTSSVSIKGEYLLLNSPIFNRVDALTFQLAVSF